MSLLESLFGSRPNSRMIALAKDVALQSCAAVWARVQHKSLVLCPAEARGYIRAHSSAIVLQQVEATMRRNRDLEVAHCVQLAEMAKDRLVKSLSDEVVRIQRTTHVTRRAA